MTTILKRLLGQSLQSGVDAPGTQNRGQPAFLCGFGMEDEERVEWNWHRWSELKRCAVDLTSYWCMLTLLLNLDNKVA